ncbi:hypothetical protein [Cesiribacter sp. SM1]|uniref:hypothetical protein n=1 Tax=Cesiribacter sp. SM1 TaxID=2861196 RepID=UPI001CD6EDBF|nr:hypothetical protein [Cesiribacter sp. SM1]
MKPTRIFLMLLALCAFTFQSCEDDTADAGKPDPSFGNHPRTAVPAELVGFWQAGSFSMSSFNDYDGSYAGQAYEIGLGYQLYANGNAEEYFYYTNTSYYCRDQILGYRKGTVTFDTQNKSFKFYSANGNYRRYYSCGSSQPADWGVQQEYGEDDLYPKHKPEYSGYSLVQEGGKTILRIPYEDGTSLDFEKTQSPQ